MDDIQKKKHKKWTLKEIARILGKSIIGGVAITGTVLFGTYKYMEYEWSNEAKEVEHRRGHIVDKLKENPTKNYTEDRYGIMIRGPRLNYITDTQLFLKYAEKMNIPKENTYVLDSSPIPDSIHVDDLTTKNSIKILFNYLSKKVDDKDFVFIYSLIHGDSENGKTKIELSDSMWNSYDLSNVISETKPKQGVFIVGSCYGGHFVNELKNSNYVVITATDSAHSARARTKYTFIDLAYSFLGPDTIRAESSFGYVFFKSLDDPKSDVNKDGKISLDEAFKYAVAHDENALLGNSIPLIQDGKDIESIILTDINKNK